MQKWEYAWLTNDIVRWRIEFSHPQERSEPIKGRKLQDFLKALGDEGWELVSVSATVLYFKRAIP